MMPLRLFAPQYWPAWLGFLILRPFVWLPYRVQMALGRSLGRLIYRLSPGKRHITEVNLRLCFPELSEAERQVIAHAHFESLGCALFETGLAWWASNARLAPLMTLEGGEHLDQSLAAGHGAILLSAHFTPLEIGLRALVLHVKPAIMYQTPKNAVIAELSMRGRRQSTSISISSDNPRALISALKRNLPAWYAPDQREHGEGAALVPFFGIPVTTNIATSRIARISKAPVLPFFSERRTDGKGYYARIGPPLEGFPSDDPLADAERFHKLIEAEIRRHPEQYLWSYKRFKRPGPDGDPYLKS